MPPVQYCATFLRLEHLERAILYSNLGFTFFPVSIKGKRNHGTSGGWTGWLKKKEQVERQNIQPGAGTGTNNPHMIPNPAFRTVYLNRQTSDATAGSARLTPKCA